MTSDEKIEIVYEKIGKLDSKMETLGFQLNRLVADAESEKATRARENSRHHAERQEQHELVYGKDGLAFRIDRLEQEKIRRDAERKWLWGILAALIVSSVLIIINSLNK